MMNANVLMQLNSSDKKPTLHPHNIDVCQDSALWSKLKYDRESGINPFTSLFQPSGNEHFIIRSHPCISRKMLPDSSRNDIYGMLGQRNNKLPVIQSLNGLHFGEVIPQGVDTKDKIRWFERQMKKYFNFGGIARGESTTNNTENYIASMMAGMTGVYVDTDVKFGDLLAIGCPNLSEDGRPIYSNTNANRTANASVVIKKHVPIDFENAFTTERRIFENKQATNAGYTLAEHFNINHFNNHDDPVFQLANALVELNKVTIPVIIQKLIDDNVIAYAGGNDFNTMSTRLHNNVKSKSDLVEATLYPALALGNARVNWNYHGERVSHLDNLCINLRATMYADTSNVIGVAMESNEGGNEIRALIQPLHSV